MIYSKEKISTSQGITLLISTIIGVGILSLPRDLVDKVNGDGFIVLIFATILCILIGFCIHKTINYFPNKTFLEINSILMTKPIAYLILIFFIIYYIYNIGLITRIFAEVMKMYMLSDTPTEVILITMLFVCSYAARGGIEAIARLSPLLIFLIIIPAVLVSSFTLNTADFTNLMPILNTKPSKLLSSIPSTIFSFSGFETFLIIGFFLRKPSETFKIQWISLVAIGLVYIFFAIVTVAVFGQKETSHLLWPTLTLVKVINIPGAFLENLDAVIMGAWVINIFMTIVVFIYIAAILLGEIMDCKESNYLVYPLIPIVYAIALYPSNLAGVYDLLGGTFSNMGQTFVILIIPISLFLLGAIRKKVKRT